MLNTTGRIASVNTSIAKGTVKTPVPQIVIDRMGVQNDAHAGPGHRQVSLLSCVSIDRFAEESGREIKSGDFGENISVEGLPFDDISPLDRIRIGEQVELVVSQIGKKCHGSGCAIFQETGTCVMPKEGIFGQVANGGVITSGDEVRLERRSLRCKILTVSDRASAGIYEDRSGPALEELLSAHFNPKPWRLECERECVPDDATQLESAARSAIEQGVDILITTGGTGLGPRDITPDIIEPLCDKMIPGIMDYVRMKYGAEKRGALLTRAIAGVTGSTLIFCLPGSVRAVREYVTEILEVLEHLIFIVHGIDRHG
jgi:molybdopterin adenylyltransferase